MTILFGHTKELLMKSFIKYEEYYDRKAEAAPLKIHEYCVKLSPKLIQEYCVMLIKILTKEAVVNS